MNEIKSSDDEFLNPSSPPTKSSPNRQRPEKKSKKVTGKSRFRWTPEMVDRLIDSLHDEKSEF